MSDKQTANNWKRWIIGAVVTAVAIGGVVGGAYWALADLWDSASPEKAEFAAYLIGVALLVCQIVVSGFRAAATDKTARAIQQTAASTEKGNVAERFKNAIEHLSNESVSVRLGGIYALHHLAHEEDDHRKRVFEILCAHIRGTTSDKAKYEPRQIADKPLVQPSIEIASVLQLLFVSNDDSEIYWHLKANLEGSNLERATLYRAYLCRADLRAANLKSALLERANLTKAKLFAADMASANLQYATLVGANFGEADLQNTLFYMADCQDCNFLSAKNLRVGQLWNARSLHKAKLRDNIKEQLELSKPELFNPPTDD